MRAWLVSQVHKNCPPQLDYLLRFTQSLVNRSTQQWYYTEQKQPPGAKADMLYITTCNATDPQQQWDLSGGRLKSVASGECADRAFQWDPLKTGPCSGSKASQSWVWNATSAEVSGQGFCLDVYSAGRVGPDVCSFACDNGPNEKWKYDGAGRTLTNLLKPGTCLTLSNGVSGGGKLWTEDSAKRRWALVPPAGQMDHVRTQAIPTATRLPRTSLRDCFCFQPGLIQFNGSVMNAAVPEWNLSPEVNGLVTPISPGFRSHDCRLSECRHAPK